jgi:hypothetical protein
VHHTPVFECTKTMPGKVLGISPKMSIFAVIIKQAYEKS